MPSEVWVRRSKYSLREDEVDEEENQYAGSHEDLRSYCDRDVVGVAGPDYTKRAGHDSGHAEAERKPGHDEFVSMTLVDLEDGHMANGATDEEEEEDRTDWNVNPERRSATKTGVTWRIGCVHSLQELVSGCTTIDSSDKYL